MIINSTLIFCLIPELNSKLSGGRIDKIRQSEDGKDLLFSIRKDYKSVHLLYSSDPVNCRLELWSQRDFDTIKDKFSDTPLFTGVIRGKIQKSRQIDFDRVIRITCFRKSELEKEKEYDLIFELTGRNTNLILINTEDNKIWDCLKKIDPARSRYRQIAPGLKYALPPPPRKKNPLEIKEDEFKHSLSQKAQIEISAFLEESFSGMDIYLAQKIIYDSSLSQHEKISELNEPEKENLFKLFQNTFLKIKEHKIEPHIIFDQKKHPLSISVFDLPFVPEEQKQSCKNLNVTIKNFFRLKIRKEKELQLRQEISTHSTKGIKAFENLLKKLEDDLKSAERYEEYKKSGDLLMINKDKIKKGQKTIKVKDIFHIEGKSLNIKLNPVLSPLQNVKLFYKKYKKAKDSLKIVKKRIAETEQKLNVLKGIFQDLETREFDLEKTRGKLVSLGLFKGKKRIKRKEKPREKFSPREFVTSDGWKILVGKNSKENDHLTFRIARSYDFWFHTQDVGGSHLVLRRENRNQQPSTKTLIQAAKIAAYFSQGRSSKKVPVIYTLAKHVRKPKKAKPGLVIVQKEKTIIVTPELPQ
ncbi:MAG: NFACT family protein [Candidatus Zixiibacteriota bacterium]